MNCGSPHRRSAEGQAARRSGGRGGAEQLCGPAVGPDSLGPGAAIAHPLSLTPKTEPGLRNNGLVYNGLTLFQETMALRREGKLLE